MKRELATQAPILPDIRKTDAKQYINELHRVILIRNQSYYQIGQYLYPMQVLAAESLSEFQEKFHFESFEEFIVTPIKDGGCGFQTPTYGKRMIIAFLYGDYIRSLLPSPHAGRLFDLPYDKLERIKSVENYLIEQNKGGFEKNADTLKDVTTMALTMATIPFRENIRDIRNGQPHKIEPDPLSNTQRRSLAWDHLYAHVLNKSKSSEDTISFKDLLNDMQIILYKIK